MTYRQKARINEDQEAREYDEELERRDREGERRGCPIGPGPECATCPRRIKERCQE